VSGRASGVVAITAGNVHTCALTKAGVAKCWGANSSGEVGDGAETPLRLTPATVSGFTGLVRARAELSTPSLSLGAHTLKASYPGDALHSPSNGSRVQTVR
jgi:hypothetical protein